MKYENVTVEIVVTANDGSFQQEIEKNTLQEAIQYLQDLQKVKVEEAKVEEF